MQPSWTGRSSYHPSALFNLYLCGYLNRVGFSRRLGREAQRIIELMWLIGRLAPDFKTIADFRRDNRIDIQDACWQFIVMCRQLKLILASLCCV